MKRQEIPSSSEIGINFVKRFNIIRKREIATRIYVVARDVTCTECRSPFKMHLALSFKAVHEVGE